MLCTVNLCRDPLRSFMMTCSALPEGGTLEDIYMLLSPLILSPLNRNAQIGHGVMQRAGADTC